MALPFAGAVPTDAIAVSHDDLPPAFPATILVGMTDQTQAPLVAIGDTHIVTVAGSTATLIDPFDPATCMFNGCASASTPVDPGESATAAPAASATDGAAPATSGNDVPAKEDPMKGLLESLKKDQDKKKP